MRIDPLDIDQPGTRFLSDRGIAKAMEYGFIDVQPRIDLEKDTARLQPATLDLKLKRVTENESLSQIYPSKEGFWPQGQTTLEARSLSEVLLTERIVHDSKVPEFNVPFIFPSVEGRSSIRRLGCFAPRQGGFFFTNPEGSHIELANYSANDILFEEGERIAQAFFRIDPFRDRWLNAFEVEIAGFIKATFPGATSRNLEETFTKARGLEMGVEVTTDEQIRWLAKEGYFSISPEMRIKDGHVLVHASKNASTINTLEGGIRFADRSSYADRIRKPLNISKGHTIKPYEHVDIETVESFKLSPFVGIEFYNNPMQKFLKQVRKRPTEEMMENLDLTAMIDGWVDPGYVGPFSRQPKWFSTSRVKPGDVIGYGRVIYFPSGVGNAYGTAALGSQYLKAKASAISK